MAGFIVFLYTLVTVCQRKYNRFNSCIVFSNRVPSQMYLEEKITTPIWHARKENVITLLL